MAPLIIYETVGTIIMLGKSVKDRENQLFPGEMANGDVSLVPVCFATLSISMEKKRFKKILLHNMYLIFSIFI